MMDVAAMGMERIAIAIRKYSRAECAEVGKALQSARMHAVVLAYFPAIIPSKNDSALWGCFAVQILR